MSDVIGDDFKSWLPGEHIMIDAQTGSGKSIFVFTALIKHCKEQHKKILYFCNRSSLKSQIDLLAKGNEDFVYVVTYQSMESRCESYWFELDFLKELCYDYIIFDESHYFVNDSTFSNYSDILFGFIPLLKSVVIFMTATPEVLVKYLEHQKIPINHTYTIEKDYAYIKKFVFL